MSEPVESDVFVCWCGASGDFGEMCAEPERTCGGMGYVNCFCGGDFCVCHNHGECQCFGCPDCEDRDDDE